MEAHVASKFVKTNKSHPCTLCGQSFPKGTRMRCDVNHFDKLKTVYVCMGCVELLDAQTPDILNDDPIVKIKEQRKKEIQKSYIITGTTQ